MRKARDKIIFSATDLVNFLVCEHLTALDLENLETPLPQAEDDEQARLIQAKGFEHEARYLDRLKRSGLSVIEIDTKTMADDEAARATHEAMAQGVDVIFQACLRQGDFMGHADFLRRVSRPSRLGDYSYEVVDTKLARSANAKFIIQLCFYSELLAGQQGCLPAAMHLVLGNGDEETFRVADYFRYYHSVKRRFLERLAADACPSYPERNPHCGLCRWRELCRSRWLGDDHLNQVANIRQDQIRKLNDGGVRSLAALARLPRSRDIPGIGIHTLARLRRQAALQMEKRKTGKDRYVLLDVSAGEVKGFRRLPRPDPGDLFFDMEGDPLEEGGLEYLFGIGFPDDGVFRYRAFWAHDREEEKAAFVGFMRFVMARLADFPHMHIYHYGAYEETALKRLMSLHGVCEAEVDHLLRARKLVDLYKVVHEGLMISEPSYSIKNLEVFYMDKRSGAVTDAGASIVYYERWKGSHDSAVLEQIRAYNEDDCRSTRLLRDWLVELRPAGLPWFGDGAGEKAALHRAGRVHEEERRFADYRERLLAGLGEDDPDYPFRELTSQLLAFHRRAAKPLWWKLFERQEMDVEALIDDQECIGGLELSDPCDATLAIPVYRYPEQEFKFKEGDRCLVSDDSRTQARIVRIDERKRLLHLECHRSLPDGLSLIPTGPLSTDVLRDAIDRFADSIIAGRRDYPAVEAVLRREIPRIKRRRPGTPILTGRRERLAEITSVVGRLDGSYLFIQGPPGAGKTYTGAHIILALLKKGFRIGVSSNSHKAINNLLRKVEELAEAEDFSFVGVKKSSDEDNACHGRFIEDVYSNEEVRPDHQLVAGTAWLFAREEMNRALDYLFVDEAGQVALANLVAMGTSTRNLVLLGDQMQLQQPVQGVHPGHSGDSTLDYLLQGRATIPEERGILLDVTWRMHEDICRFISEAVYDGRLRPEKMNQNQRLILNDQAHEALHPTGIHCIEVEHDGCTQSSMEEARIVEAVFESLLHQEFQDRNGNIFPLKMENILVVAPYNMQVNLLKSVLPEGARVGTIDKFQGQEAEVVIVSMTTSSEASMPRHIDFLYSKNRLNVALSRARCLALLVFNPALMTIKCKTVEQMALVNTLCWVKDWSMNQA